MLHFLLDNKAPLSLCEEALRSGADIEARNSQGQTPLMCALADECLSLLLANGANVDARDHDGNTCVHLTARRFLLYGLVKDIDARNNNGETPLFLLMKHPKVFPQSRLAMVRCGADVNARDREGRSIYDVAPRHFEFLWENGLHLEYATTSWIWNYKYTVRYWERREIMGFALTFPGFCENVGRMVAELVTQ